MKRLLSLLLTICILLSCTVTAFAAKSPVSPYGTDLPTIYVHGQGTPLIDRDENGKTIYYYPVELSDEFIETHIKGNLDVFAKAFFTQKWDKFCEVFTEALVTLFADLRLDEHGNAPNGAYPKWELATFTKKYDGKYRIDQFVFEYDWRKDPFVIADELHAYIERVMDATGAEKVNLIGRCLGASITTAYAYKYQGEHLASYILYNSAMNGISPCSKSFAGEIWLMGDGIGRYIYDVEPFEETVNTLLQSFVTLLGKTYGLDLASWAVNNVYRKIYMQIVPPVLSQTFGTFPSFWSMVNDRDYEKAKATVFYGQEEKWADFMDVIDNFHYNVQLKMPEIVQMLQDKGVHVFSINKYGTTNMPVNRESELLSDGICLVSDSSWGATTSTVMGTLDKKYLQNADPKYISPDKQIDASTCLMPDTTWFVKNLPHKLFPASMEELLATVLDNPEMTVFSDARFPQYIVYDREGEAIAPMTVENCDTYGRYKVSFFTALKRFWKSLFTVIRNYVQSKRSKEQ